MGQKRAWATAVWMSAFSLEAVVSGGKAAVALGKVISFIGSTSEAAEGSPDSAFSSVWARWSNLLGRQTLQIILYIGVPTGLQKAGSSDKGL